MGHVGRTDVVSVCFAMAKAWLRADFEEDHLALVMSMCESPTGRRVKPVPALNGRAKFETIN